MDHMKADHMYNLDLGSLVFVVEEGDIRSGGLCPRKTKYFRDPVNALEYTESLLEKEKQEGRIYKDETVTHKIKHYRIFDDKKLKVIMQNETLFVYENHWYIRISVHPLE
jgi:hypothetical protein